MSVPRGALGWSAVCDGILTFMVPDILKLCRLVVLAGARYYDSSLAIIIEYVLIIEV